MDDAMDQLMRDKIADSLKDFHLWTDLVRSGEAEVTGLTVKRKPKKWVGLDDEERNEITNTVMIDIWQVARAIEDKLREKNT